MQYLKDLKDETKKEFPLTVFCEKDIENMIKDLRAQHGIRKTAEIVRRILRAELPAADAYLKS